MVTRSYPARRSGERSVVFETAVFSEDPTAPDLVEIGFARNAKPGDRPVYIAVRRDNGVNASDLQRLPWARWFRWAETITRYSGLPEANGRINTSEFSVGWAQVEPPTAPPRVRRPGRRGHPDEHYERVAEIYKRFLADGRGAPTARLAKSEYVSRNTAAGWIRAARRRGLLPPAQRGRAG
jgi:hypothetical protein